MNNSIIKKLFLLCLLALSACSDEEKPQPETISESEDSEEGLFISNKQFDENQLTFFKPTLKVFPSKISATGKTGLPPQFKAEVTTVMGGIIRKLMVREGDRVRKGQQVATIENHDVFDIQKEYARLSTELDFLNKEMERKKQLAAEKIIANKEFLAAQNAFASANTRLKSLRAELEVLHLSPTAVAAGEMVHTVPVYAPIEGEVMEIAAVMGSSLSPSMSMMTIVNKNRLRLELNVFEKDIAAVRQGQKIIFTIPELGIQDATATVQNIGTSLGEDRKVKVFGALTKPLSLLDGMFVDAEIVTDTVEAWSFDADAIVQQEAEFLALALDKQTTEGYYLKPVALQVEERYQDAYRLKETPTQEQFLGKGVFQLLAE